jgi:hypothetical protein
LYRRKKVATTKVPLRAKSSPTTVLLTPDVPIRQNVPSTSAPRAKKMAEALAKDAMPKNTSAGGSEKVVMGVTTSKEEEMADKAMNTLKWKNHVDALFHLDSPQEQASDTVSSAMIAFVQRTECCKRGMYSLYPPSAMVGSRRKYIMVLLEKLL